MSPLFRPSFWISFQTSPFTGWVHSLVGSFLVALAVTTLAVGFYRRTITDKALKRVWSSLFACLVCATTTGGVLYGMTWQAVPVLGMRIFWPVWFFSHLAWGIWIYRFAYQRIPLTRAAEAKRQAYEKWLPKAKKR